MCGIEDGTVARLMPLSLPHQGFRALAIDMKLGPPTTPTSFCA